MRTQINQKLEESGERERLKELLRARLRECGWREQLKEHCRGWFTKMRCHHGLLHATNTF